MRGYINISLPTDIHYTFINSKAYSNAI